MNAKGMSNSGTIHLFLSGSQVVAACASGKVQPLLIPLTAAEGDRPVTCKRCLRIEARTAAAATQERITAAADTSNIDALLEATSVQAITAALEAGIAEVEADGDAEGAAALRETAPEVIDEATASDAEAAEEAAERDAAEVQADPGMVEHLDTQDATDAAMAQVRAQEAEAQAAEVPAPRRARVNQKDIVLAFLAAHRGKDFTPHAISKAVTPAGTKALGLRDCLARLAADGKVEVVGAKPATYRLILDAQYAEGLPADDAS